MEPIASRSDVRSRAGSLRAERAPVQRVELAVRTEHLDPAGQAAAADLRAAGLEVSEVRVVRTFFLMGPDETGAWTAAHEALADPVEDRLAVNAALPITSGTGNRGRPRVVSVLRKPGVTNPEAESARIVLEGLSIPADAVQSARTYYVWTPARPAAVVTAARRALGNDVIETVVQGRIEDYAFPISRPSSVRRRTVSLQGLDGAQLELLQAQMGLSLSRAEMETIQKQFAKLRRDPTDVELETLAQTWSEHCKHKTLTSAVRIRDHEGERRYDNLLKETVFEATRRLAKPWCWSVFEDNAGVIDFDGVDGVCMKVETHNHPSAIEPYGGAGTGIGGVIRDILGTGLGARPIANTDVFCFGDPSLPADEIPKGCLHPLRLMKGVVSGVRDYGNRMGIPTVNGAILFDPRYVGNPVVFAGCVGLIPRKAVRKAARVGDLLVAFGGRTGRDGIHGATFSSVELHAESETVSSGAVQIGDPITEKKVLDVLIAARDQGYFHAITDCGAGGFSSAVGEMAEKLGAEVDMAAAPLKYEGLDGFEIWISEAQERMVAAVAPAKWPAFRRLCASEDVEAVVLGRFTGDRRLRVRFGKTLLADLDMEFLHNGLPRIRHEATFEPGGSAEPKLRSKARYDRDLLDLLAMPQIGSKEWVIRQYDHEVQASAVVRPLVGPHHGPSDAAVLAPKLGSKRGIVLSNGVNPAYGDIDPYHMAMSAVDEALRNAIATGADLRRIAVLDNFTWGSCKRPDMMGTIVRAAEGCRDAALLFGVPFISGKDSLSNEFRTEDGTLIVVPSTLLISAIGVIPDVRRTCTMDLKRVGNPIYVVGETHDELGGGHWYRLRGVLGTNVPVVRKAAPKTMRAVAALVKQGLVRAAHDPSEGGLAVALAEMAFASPFGLELDLSRIPATTRDPARRLFSESATRFVLEVDGSRQDDVEAALGRTGVPFARAGKVVREPLLRVRARPNGSRARRVVIESKTSKLRHAWRHALPLSEER